MGSHSERRLADVATRVEIEVGLGVVGHHPRPGGQHRDERQQREGQVVDRGPEPAGRPPGLPIEADPATWMGCRSAQEEKVRDPTRVIGSVNNLTRSRLGPRWARRVGNRAGQRNHDGASGTTNDRRNPGPEQGSRYNRGGLAPRLVAPDRRSARWKRGDPRLAPGAPRRRLPRRDRTAGRRAAARRRVRAGLRVGPAVWPADRSVVGIDYNADAPWPSPDPAGPGRGSRSGR